MFRDESCRHAPDTICGECRRNYSTKSGTTRGVRLLTLQALSGTGGAPVVSSLLSPRIGKVLGECSQDYRIEHPAAPGGRAFDSPLASMRMRSSSGIVLASLVASTGKDECVQDYIGKWRFESARRAERFVESPADNCRPTLHAERRMPTGIQVEAVSDRVAKRIEASRPPSLEAEWQKIVSQTPAVARIGLNG